jgi:hypothetical protein
MNLDLHGGGTTPSPLNYAEIREGEWLIHDF